MSFSNFIEEYPLLKKYTPENSKLTPLQLHELSFTYFCDHDKLDTTFELKIRDIHIIEKYKFESQTLKMRRINEETMDFETQILKERSNTDYEDMVIFEGLCGLCKKKKIEVILKFSSKATENGIISTIQKVGQFPPITVISNKETYNFLTKDDKDLYSKARQCLNFNYGIGAFAYLRRIIENEIKRIIEELINAKIENFEKIQQVYNKFLIDHQMEKLIKETNDYIPESVKFNGQNPLNILYKQLSGGIHEFDDNICLEKAENIDLLLSFVISQINKEKSESVKIRNAFKSLLG